MTATLKDVLLKGQAAHQKIIPDSMVMAFEEPTSEPFRLLLTYRIFLLLQRLGVHGAAWSLAFVVFIPTMVLDILLSALRFPAYPLFLVFRNLEKKLRFRTIHCPFCYTPVNDRFVQCKKCGVIRGSMRPRDFETMTRVCSRCKTSYVRLFAIYLWPPKARVACRPTPTEYGCNRQLPEAVDWGQTTEFHLAVCGPATSIKLEVLSLIWKYLVVGGGNFKGALAGRGTPAWSQTADEFDLLNSQLANGSSLKDTTRGISYSLGHSGMFLVRRWYGTRLLNFHNLPDGWTRGPDTVVAMKYMHIMYDRAILFVADLPSAAIPSSNARLFAKLVHIAEQLGGNRSWDRPFFGKIVVVVPVTDRTEITDFEALLRERDPQFWALLKKTAGRKLKFVGGAVSRSGSVPDWIAHLVDQELA